MDYILKIDCNDEKGLILRVSEIVFKHGLNYVSTSEFVDHENSRFYMRAVVVGQVNTIEFQNTLSAYLPSDSVIFFEAIKKKDIVILATKENHCLGDLLIKHSSKDLNANILAIIANHDTLRPLSDKFDIPFTCISTDGLDRVEHEKLVLKELEKYKFDYMVLAKYMRILSPDFVKRYPKKIINIHHSFLPAFIGANPYKQAYERGVKIIGATAHFVTDDLDEGPIITQDVIRVNHEMNWKDMQKAGRDVEKVVLSNALELVFDERVFVYDNKTVIF
ncbi:MAG: formyltetrahydrofolate deformylase [Campylobacter lanienae]|uniref:formyltetrahydrofolate deformylase n=1 Tax=Campylobacter TaxID=194 RepID=UPI000A33A046|nr:MULTISPECIES: formyltetrahydrofolate deformylase [Campylobacter]MCI5539451.1 formyltetrahydrofolate deformylase [Campylobacter lanienae]MDD7514559.1 formyltetrahydrofolate deformylase [Campylobacter lanienae]MDY5519090.1 formyltetrahydrofolate deformylase [Campylobacter lanienae]MDY6056925.1 formyltetrahydrofolate deformylase [Campylobacter lanienae]